MKTTSLMFFLLLGLSACSSTDSQSAFTPNRDGQDQNTPVESPDDALVGTLWVLESMGEATMPDSTLFPTRLPEIRFQAETSTVQGNSGCNGYSAGYTLDGSSLYFGEPGPSTMMYCGPGENRFREAMEAVDAFVIRNAGQLTLLAGGAPVLSFRAS